MSVINYEPKGVYYQHYRNKDVKYVFLASSIWLGEDLKDSSLIPVSCGSTAKACCDIEKNDTIMLYRSLKNDRLYVRTKENFFEKVSFNGQIVSRFSRLSLHPLMVK